MQFCHFRGMIYLHCSLEGRLEIIISLFYSNIARDALPRPGRIIKEVHLSL